MSLAQNRRFWSKRPGTQKWAPGARILAKIGQNGPKSAQNRAKIPEKMPQKCFLKPFCQENRRFFLPKITLIRNLHTPLFGEVWWTVSSWNRRFRPFWGGSRKWGFLAKIGPNPISAPGPKWLDFIGKPMKSILKWTKIVMFYANFS